MIHQYRYRRWTLPDCPSAAPSLTSIATTSAKLLEDPPVLWSHPGVTHEQREELVREVFHRITIDGKEFMSIEPNAPYAPLFASIVTSEEFGYWEPNSTRSPRLCDSAPSIQFRKSGYSPHRNWLFLTDLLTNRIAQINTNHHKHTQPTVWNGNATLFIIQFGRFRNCPAEAVAVRRTELFLGINLFT